MKIKVCGMKFPDNIDDVSHLEPDFMGFIFYEKSPRNVEVSDISPSVNSIKDSISKVGVFVNESPQKVIETCKTLHLDYAQLHGEEPVEDIIKIKLEGIRIIKVFSLHTSFDWSICEPYLAQSDLFLFDTSSPLYGGSGKKFNWDILKTYPFEKDFFLSGGISAEDIPAIKDLDIPNLMAVDINSRMETAPGLKSLSLVNQFFKEIKS